MLYTIEFFKIICFCIVGFATCNVIVATIMFSLGFKDLKIIINLLSSLVLFSAFMTLIYFYYVGLFLLLVLILISTVKWFIVKNAVKKQHKED